MTNTIEKLGELAQNYSEWAEDNLCVGHTEFNTKAHQEKERREFGAHNIYFNYSGSKCFWAIKFSLNGPLYFSDNYIEFAKHQRERYVTFQAPINFTNEWLEEIYVKASKFYEKLVTDTKEKKKQKAIEVLAAKEKELKKISEDIADARKVLSDVLGGK